MVRGACCRGSLSELTAHEQRDEALELADRGGGGVHVRDSGRRWRPGAARRRAGVDATEQRGEALELADRGGGGVHVRDSGRRWRPGQAAGRALMRPSSAARSSSSRRFDAVTVAVATGPARDRCGTRMVAFVMTSVPRRSPQRPPPQPRPHS